MLLVWVSVRSTRTMDRDATNTPSMIALHILSDMITLSYMHRELTDFFSSRLSTLLFSTFFFCRHEVKIVAKLTAPSRHWLGKHWLQLMNNTTTLPINDRKM